MKIGDVASFQNGYAFKSKDFILNGKYKIIKIKELKSGKVKFFDDSASIDIDNPKDYEKYIVKRGDILFALTGDPVNKNNPLSWVGRASIYENDFPALLNQRVCKLIPSNAINSRYLYYYFRDFENFYALASIAKGSASQANISSKDIENVDISLPPLKLQNRIVEILDCISNKINTNTEINNNLEQQAQTIFEHYFTNNEFEVKRKCRLGEVCDCLLGGTPSRAMPQYWNGNISWINSGEVNRFRITTPSEYITEEGLNHSATKLLPAKTTVLAITGATLGQVSLLEIDSCANQSVVGVVPNEVLPYEFIYPFIKSNIKELISHQTGGAQQHINKQNIESINVRIPNDSKLNEYINIVAPMYATISTNCFEIESLINIRDSLLPKLMSGELDVSDVDI